MRRTWLLLAGLLLVVVLVYVPATSYFLVYDDHEQLEANPRLKSWTHVPAYFLTHHWAHAPLAAANYYRPLSLLWFRLEHAVFGEPGSRWHIPSLLAHLVAIGAVFLLARRLSGDDVGALAATSLFALHPFQAETVVWISSGPDILFTIFLVLCVFFHVRRAGPVSFVSLLFAMLSAFTKESGIVAPALIFAYEWTRSRFKDAVSAAIPYAVIPLLYFAARVNAIGSITSAIEPDLTPLQTILTLPRVLGIYSLHLIWPFNLSPSYGVPVETRIWPLLILMAVLGGLCWFARGASANVKFGAAWFAITLAPSLSLGYLTRSDFTHDRYLYLPSVGLVLVTAEFLKGIKFTLPKRAVAGVIILVCCVGIRLYLPVWENDIALFTRAVERAPHNPYVRNNLGDAYLKANRPADAFPHLQRGIELNPDYGLLYYNMARYHRMLGNYEESERYFTISDRLHPANQK